MKKVFSTCRQRKISLQIQFRKLVQKVASWLEVQEEKEESLVAAQARVWVDVLQKQYTREQQNEILTLAGKILIERREQEIADTFRDLTNLKNTNTELCNLRLI
jgi:hypothetical protein